MLQHELSSQIWSPISFSEESLVPFLIHSPRPSSVSGWCFKPKMPIHSPGTDRCRATPASGIFFRIYSKQVAAAFWRVNFTNCIRLFFRRTPSICPSRIRSTLCSRFSPKQDFGMFFAVNMAFYGLAAAGNLTIVYPLDYARTRLPSDVGSGRNLRRFVRLS